MYVVILWEATISLFILDNLLVWFSMAQGQSHLWISKTMKQNIVKIVFWKPTGNGRLRWWPDTGISKQARVAQSSKLGSNGEAMKLSVPSQGPGEKQQKLDSFIHLHWIIR